jgi:acetyl esterase/lipase
MTTQSPEGNRWLPRVAEIDRRSLMPLVGAGAALLMLPRNALAQQNPIPKIPAEVPSRPPAGALPKEQTISAKLMAMDAVPRSNTEAGRRILKGAPAGGPVFKTFADFLGAVAARKIEPIDVNPPVPDSINANLDVVFQKGDNYELGLNLFTPKNPDKALPLVVMVHGGCWIDGGRVDYNYYGVKLAQLGYAAATVDYRVADQARYPAAVDDVRNAIQWLKDHAKTYNIDPSRIALLGGSAGGHLVELIGYSANTPTKQHPEGPGPKLKAIVAFYGWSDLTDPTVRDFYWNEAFLGKKYADAAELYKQASPITHVSKQSSPTILLQGTIDAIVPLSQSAKLAKALDARDVPYVYAPFEGQFHAFDYFKDTTERALYFIEKFLVEYL